MVLKFPLHHLNQLLLQILQLTKILSMQIKLNMRSSNLLPYQHSNLSRYPNINNILLKSTMAHLLLQHSQVSQSFPANNNLNNQDSNSISRHTKLNNLIKEFKIGDSLLSLHLKLLHWLIIIKVISLNHTKAQVLHNSSKSKWINLKLISHRNRSSLKVCSHYQTILFLSSLSNLISNRMHLKVQSQEC